MGNRNANIFERLQAGETVSMDDPQYYQVREAGARTAHLMKEFNATADRERVRAIWEAISGYPLDTSTIISVPFHINIGQFTRIGKNVFINQSCLFLDMGTITIEDDVLIGPDVKLLTEEHPLKPSERHSLKVRPIVIKQNAWIGAGATILPGITVGQNAVVAAEALVNKDVPDNTVVAGMPAKVMKEIK